MRERVCFPVRSAPTFNSSNFLLFSHPTTECHKLRSWTHQFVLSGYSNRMPLWKFEEFERKQNWRFPSGPDDLEPRTFAAVCKNNPKKLTLNTLAKVYWFAALSIRFLCRIPFSLDLQFGLIHIIWCRQIKWRSNAPRIACHCNLFFS